MDGISVTETQPLKPKTVESSNKENAGIFDDVPVGSFAIACLANLYEYYDFALLGFFAEEVGSALFPPGGSDVSYAIEVYTLYAVGFFFRPFGGAFFGYMGDRIGRKMALRITMIMMAFPTMLTGCLPTYSMIGWWSPALLLLFRIAQGLSTGGENANVCSYVFEIAKHDKRALFMSLLGVCTSGTLVASLFHVILTASMSSEDLFSFGWRIPFLFGIGLIFVALWGKNNMQESETFVEMQNAQVIRSNPLKHACTNHFDIIIKFMLVSCLQHASAYSTYVFLPSYLSSKSMHGWSDSSAYGINAINNLISLPLILLIGYWTDILRYKALTFIYPGCILSFLFSPVLFYGFSQTDSIWQDWALQCLLVLIYCLVHGCIFYWYISSLLVDPRTRVTLFGVGYNLGAACFGGTASLIGSALVASEGSEVGITLLGVWLSFLSLVTMATVFYVEKSNKNKPDVLTTSYLSQMPLKQEESDVVDVSHVETNGNNGGEYEKIDTDQE